MPTLVSVFETVLGFALCPSLACHLKDASCLWIDFLVATRCSPFLSSSSCMYVCIYVYLPVSFVRQLLQNFESLTDLQSRRLLTLLRISVFFLLRFCLFPRLLVEGCWKATRLLSLGGIRSCSWNREEEQ